MQQTIKELSDKAGIAGKEHLKHVKRTRRTKAKKSTYHQTYVDSSTSTSGTDFLTGLVIGQAISGGGGGGFDSGGSW